MNRTRKRLLLGAAALAGGAVIALAGLLAFADHVPPPARGTDISHTLAARFAVLSHAHTNRCGMPASAVDLMPSSSRLQGSCCFPMNYASYVKQLHELKRYAAVAVIPRDPYDIPVGLATRLIGYQSITLTPAEQRIYDRAKPLSKTKGPCCCPCWRWTAFGGQAKYLIARRHYTARQVADVWSVEECCGGPSGA